MAAHTVSDSNQLSAEDLELLAYLLEDEGVELAERQTIFPRSQSDRLPLSFAQTRLWFMDQLEPGIAVYNLPFAIRVTGRLDIAVLRRSLNTIVRRHEVLRTAFPTVDNQPVQLILPAIRLPLPLLDLRALPADQQEAQIARQATREAQQAFDLAHGPLITSRLLRLAEDEHVVLLTIHHIVFDGWSMGLFLQEVMTLYDAFANGERAPLPDLPIQYADFAVWQRDWLQGEALEQQLNYWRRQLTDGKQGGAPILDLPTDRPRPPRQTFKGAHCFRPMPPALIERLTALSQQENATLFMTLLAAFNVLLSRYSGQEDMIVGSPIANRDFVEIERLMGFFVNTLLLRTDLSGGPTFRELLRRVRDMTFAAYAHQNIPFERLVDELQPERDLSHHPLFQVMFIFQNAPMPSYERTDLRMRFLKIESGVSKFDMVLAMIDTPAGINMVLEYNTALFERPTMQRLVKHYLSLLEGALADPDRPIAQLPLLQACERQQILVEWNDTAIEVVSQGSEVRRSASGAALPHEWFVAQAARAPDAVALAFDDPTKDEGATSAFAARSSLPIHLTYNELDRRANQLAHALIARGSGPEERVGLLLGRSPEMIVGIMGILKSGAAYVPLDPSYPPDRLAFMLEDSQVRILVTKDEGLTTKDESAGASLAGIPASRLDLRSDAALLAQMPADRPNVAPDPANLAYVIYTSGSTGRPKGVMIDQRAVSNFTASSIRLFAVTPRDRVLQFASFCFDVSVFEIFTALLAGATLCLTSRDTLLSPPALTELMRRHAVSIFDIPPTVLSMLPPDELPDVRVMFIGIEKFAGELVNRWALPQRRFYNGYGPTEATVAMTVMDCVGRYQQSPPIGRPMANHRAYVLNARMQPAPIGVPGELYVTGAGLARGYLGRPDLTAERFVPNPFAQGSGFRDQGSGARGLGLGVWGLGADPDPRTLIPDPRLYRTGDLARALPDGNIEFLGRTDHQIKIRGFRVELGEIETVLRQHPAVREIAVVAHALAPGDVRLAAYVVPAKDEGPRTKEGADPSSALLDPSSLAAELYAWAQERLPEHMIPSALMLLDALPLTSSGKLDRRALPAPEWSRRARQAEYAAPRTPVEQQVADMMAQALGVERVSLHDNFFALGGHSLLATRLVMRMSETFGVKLPLRSLFEAPTIANLAERIETLLWVVQDGAELSGVVAEGHEQGAI